MKARKKVYIAKAMWDVERNQKFMPSLENLLSIRVPLNYVRTQLPALARGAAPVPPSRANPGDSKRVSYGTFSLTIYCEQRNNVEMGQNPSSHKISAQDRYVKFSLNRISIDHVVELSLT